MIYKKEMLDKRICDVEPEATNTETYREFIRYAEVRLCQAPEDIDSMTDEELTSHIDWLDEMLFK